MSNLRVSGSTPPASDPTSAAVGTASAVAAASGRAAPEGGGFGPAAGTSGPGALGLGLDVGIVAMPGASPAVEPAPLSEPGLPTDRFDRDVPSGVSASPRSQDAAEEGLGSPFAGLGSAAAGLEDHRLSEKQVGVEQQIDPSLELAQKLAALERKLGPEHAAQFNKLRLGAMLVTADAQASREGQSAVPPKVIETLAARILAKGKTFSEEDHRAFLKLQTQFHGAIGQNIQAYVQRVLRECYLIQNQQLMDYADKVRHFNDLKKKTREVLEKARATKTAWAAEGRGQESFIASTPFDWLEVGDDGETFVPTMTAEDVERWRVEAQAAADGAKSSGTSMGAVAAQFASLYGESQLSEDDIDTLNRVKKDRGYDGWKLWEGGQTDDYIREHMDGFLPLIPRMNKDDLKTYLVPVIAALSHGNADEAELLQVFGAMTPAQYLYFMSGVEDFTNRAQDFSEAGAAGGAAAGALAGLGVLSVPLGLAGALIGGFWDRIRGGDIFDEEQQDELDQLGRRNARSVADAAGADFSGDLTKEKATELLAALNAQVNSDGAAGSGAGVAGEPAVGSPKQIRTLQGMEDYIKKLEDELNSIGDDAQLANVDLQNELQKQQQTLQMLTNISKMLHDTALAIVRKIGG